MFPVMTVTQEFTLTLAPKGRRGKDAEVEAGSVTWGSSDPAVARVEVNPANQLEARIIAQGVGPYTISASADADLGAGAVVVSVQDSGEVALGQAETVEFGVGPVIEQPEVVPEPEPLPEPEPIL